MDEDIKKIFSLLPDESGLSASKIIAGVKEKITEYRRLQARRRFIFGVVALPISLFLSIPAFRLLLSEITDSGFLEYIKLIFSDISGVLPYWRESISILAESFPALSFFVLFSLFALFLFAIQSIVVSKNSRMRLGYLK